MKAQDETLGRTVFSSGLCPIFVSWNLSSLWSGSFFILITAADLLAPACVRCFLGRHYTQMHTHMFPSDREAYNRPMWPLYQRPTNKFIRTTYRSVGKEWLRESGLNINSSCSMRKPAEVTQGPTSEKTKPRVCELGHWNKVRGCFWECRSSFPRDQWHWMSVHLRVSRGSRWDRF